eukprot:gnl/Chilomastix_cuspidata/4299.p1 GENE.gnl/Chilomastix_cuspidata/4299~~gnl/Chilomastix_cuspidata/4299.p1  ORF type:complete len:757 (-),score=297.83 gnl/Chilomastix_cuspidata/4299:1415-3685(-)
MLKASPALKPRLPLPELAPAFGLIFGAEPVSPEEELCVGGLLELWDFISLFRCTLGLGRHPPEAAGARYHLLDWSSDEASKHESSSSSTLSSVWVLDRDTQPPEPTVVPEEPKAAAEEPAGPEEEPSPAPTPAVEGYIPRCFSFAAFARAFSSAQTLDAFHLPVNPLLYAVISRLVAQLLRTERAVEFSDPPDAKALGMRKSEFRNVAMYRGNLAAGNKDAVMPHMTTPAPTVQTSRSAAFPRSTLLSRRRLTRRRAAKNVQPLKPETPALSSEEPTLNGSETQVTRESSSEFEGSESASPEPTAPLKRRSERIFIKKTVRPSPRWSASQRRGSDSEDFEPPSISSDMEGDARSSAAHEEEPLEESTPGRAGSTCADWAQVLGDYIEELDDSLSCDARAILRRLGYSPASSGSQDGADAPTEATFETLPLRDKMTIVHVLIREVLEQEQTRGFMGEVSGFASAIAAKLHAFERELAAATKSDGQSELKKAQEAETEELAAELAETKTELARVAKEIHTVGLEVSDLEFGGADGPRRSLRAKLSARRRVLKKLQTQQHRLEASAHAIELRLEKLPVEFAAQERRVLFRVKREVIRRSTRLQSLRTRTDALGSDREYRVFFGFPTISSHIFAVDLAGRWFALAEPDALAFAQKLDTRGLREAALRRRIQQFFKGARRSAKQLDEFLAEYARAPPEGAADVPKFSFKMDFDEWMHETIKALPVAEDLRFVNDVYEVPFGQLRIGEDAMRSFLFGAASAE